MLKIVNLEMLCVGLEAVKNVLVHIGDECGDMTTIPTQSLPPILQAMKILVKSKVASN